ncbi:hypothetical protein niasHT_000424 [Heterodera trifolii]|uniref:Uncharacterized protein n=1 Tax=Heterodera trifolii TaxID=157864 RepID=A0ABD2LWD4_9BILA
MSLFDAIRLVFRKGRNMGLFTKGYLDQMLLIERAVVNLRNSYKVTVVNNAIWVVIYEECRLCSSELARFILNLEVTHREVSARRNFPSGIISSELSVPRPPPRVKPPHPTVHNEPNYLVGHPVSREQNQFDYATIDPLQPVFDAIRLAFQNGHKNAWLMNTHLRPKCYSIERVLLNMDKHISTFDPGIKRKSQLLAVAFAFGQAFTRHFLSNHHLSKESP